jgi:SAM-dependent methyltransferase
VAHRPDRDADPADVRAGAASLRDPASFRDPSGFVYRRDGTLLRQVDRSFGARWDDIVRSGMLDRLQAAGRLIPHQTADPTLAADERAHAVVRPEELPFISYPYEWSFGMLRDAALLTLDVQAEIAADGFTLRDASAYNVQFRQGRPILIDSLSFERATPGAPWVAYRQFCQHFLAPLALMARRDIRLGGLLREHLDGIPLDLAAALLPGRTRLSMGLGAHLHVHARAQRRHSAGAEAAGAAARSTTVSRTGAEALIDSLRRTIAGLDWRPDGTEWADYDRADTAEPAVRAKDALVAAMLRDAGGTTVWDLGANTGRYSAIAADLGRVVTAWDADPGAVERHYRTIRRDGVTTVLPLLVDLANPSPRIGWALEERPSFLDRANADVVLALALVHHLAIGRNVPLAAIAAFFARIGPNLIVEFVERDDPMVGRLLSTREDVFPDYNVDGFRAAFGRHFRVEAEHRILDTRRILFRMTRTA